jgi:hypothetical protein
MNEFTINETPLVLLVSVAVGSAGGAGLSTALRLFNQLIDGQTDSFQNRVLIDADDSQRSGCVVRTEKQTEKSQVLRAPNSSRGGGAVFIIPGAFFSGLHDQ